MASTSPAPRSPPPSPGIEVLYLEDDLVVANKPGGLLVHRTRESTDRVVLLQLLGGQLGRHLYPVHRLDRAASGAIAFAFSSATARALQASLQAPDAVKEYLVLVRGEIAERGVTERPLTDRRTGQKKPARTEWEVIARFSRMSLLRARIRTGRRHQIRRHFAHLAHQVIGCTQHGKGRINRFLRETYGLPRLALHASLLDIPHPSREGRLRVQAPLAGDLREFLQRLPDTDEALVRSL